MGIYSMEHGSVVDTSLGAQIIQKFIAENEDMDVLAENIQMSVSLKISYFDVVQNIKDLLDSSRAACPTFRRDYIFIHGEVGGHKVLIMVSSNNHRSETSLDDDAIDSVGTLDLKIDIYGEPFMVTSLSKQVKGLFEQEKVCVVKWWYDGSHGAASRDIHLDRPNTYLHEAFYPDLGDPYKFMDEYLRSDAAVLLIAGEPGTGKTTFLRHMIIERKLAAHVIYDEKLMEKDSIFQSFLFDKDGDMMVIEDADTILSPREDDGNKMMSRFLSVSDGLIKLPNKKLVFTTNLTDFGKVDPALLRPGRCFRVVNMRPLTLPEAQRAAEVAGMPIPIERKEYTLAEIFNQGYKAEPRGMGFLARGH